MGRSSTIGLGKSSRQTADNDTLPSQNSLLTLKTSRMTELAGCAQQVLDFEEVGLSIKTNLRSRCVSHEVAWAYNCNESRTN